MVAIIGILVAQLLWTKKAFNLEEKKFSQSVHIALLEVVKSLYLGTNHELPSENPIQKISNDYYIVNVDNDFEPKILEFYLKSEFEKRNIITDFEYAMYNCQSDEMVYGNYVSFVEKEKEKENIYFSKHTSFVYYFAVRFPDHSGYIFSELKFWLALSFALMVILIIYVYSIFTILQQKKYSELQRDFINNMTHEFKTPLSSILIASNYLSKQNKIQSDDKLEKYTQIIISQSKKLNEHIEKILNIAKSDRAPLQLDKKIISVTDAIKTNIENIKLKYNPATIHIHSEENYAVEADEFHFNNIIYNLLDNSVKYCDDQPEINIRLSKVNTSLILQFIDNGIGISNKNISFIFDKFYRIQNNKNNGVEGFGLGLYYVKKICKLHQWDINVTGNPEKGTTFTIIIPLKNE